MLDTKWDMEEALRVRGKEERDEGRAEGQEEANNLMCATFAWVKREFGIAKAMEIMENPVEYDLFLDKFQKPPEYARFTGIDKP